MKSIFAFAIVVTASPLWAHYHISVGVDGSRLAMANYGTTDAGSSLHYDSITGYLLDSANTPVVQTLASYAPVGVGAAGPGGAFVTAPTYYGSAFTLTTDYYTSSGSPAFANSGGVYDPSADPLVGSGRGYPDIVYRFVGLTPLNGAPADTIAYNVPANTTGVPQSQVAYANSGGPNTSSLDYGYGNHIHGVTLYSLQPGLYALGIVAHDASGRFADSAPAYFEINAVPEPSAVVAGWIGGAMLLRRRR